MLSVIKPYIIKIRKYLWIILLLQIKQIGGSFSLINSIFNLIKKFDTAQKIRTILKKNDIYYMNLCCKMFSIKKFTGLGFIYETSKNIYLGVKILYKSAFLEVFEIHNILKVAIKNPRSLVCQ